MGNSRLHSTLFNCLRFYSRVFAPVILFYTQIFLLLPSWPSPNSEIEGDAILLHPFHCRPAVKPVTGIDEALEAIYLAPRKNDS